MAKKAKVGFVSLGCSKNLCDTEIMLRHLVDEGYEITPEETEADVVIVNTCAFIESAKKESIDNIIDLGWLKKHNGLKGSSSRDASPSGTGIRSRRSCPRWTRSSAWGASTGSERP